MMRRYIYIFFPSSYVEEILWLYFQALLSCNLPFIYVGYSTIFFFFLFLFSSLFPTNLKIYVFFFFNTSLLVTSGNVWSFVYWVPLGKFIEWCSSIIILIECKFWKCCTFSFVGEYFMGSSFPLMCLTKTFILISAINGVLFNPR